MYSFLRLDLNKLLLLKFMWIFILKDFRNYFIYRTISATIIAAAAGRTTRNTQELQQLHYQQQEYER